MLNTYEAYVVELSYNGINKNLICNRAEMLAFVNSGLKVRVTDYITELDLFDSDKVERNAEQAIRLIKQIKQDEQTGKKYRVLVTDDSENTEDLVCNLARMLAFVNSGLKVRVTDYDTGEVVFDSDYPEYAAFEGTKLVKSLNRQTFLDTLAEELDITDDLGNTVPTEDEIIAEVKRLYDENHELRLKKFKAENPSPALRRIHNIHIMDMGLSNRTYNCLKRAGKEFVGDILQMTEDDMIKVRNLGRKSLKEIKVKLAELGVALKGSKLSFDDKVAICCKYHQNCRMCPLAINSVDCFYNESKLTSDAVDTAMGKTPVWLDPNMELKPVIHHEDEDDSDDHDSLQDIYEDEDEDDLPF